ncbi:MAG: FkbM family methyltransferase [Alphaproteobacteria bacterium]|nr:FkbM family methyltransferase [Alphaproteobacteria bacterium]
MTGTHRLSMALVLENLRRRGFSPATVIDVGAHTGTALLSGAFPLAHHMMIEPLVEHGSALQTLCSSLSSAEYLIAAAGNREGAVRMAVNPTNLHSTMLPDGAGAEPPFKERLVHMRTLDRLVQDNGLKGPFLVKIDVDGGELDVLRGACSLLDESSVFIIELTFFHDVLMRILTLFHGFDFVPFDIADPLYRERDDALWQIDLVLVHKNSFLRSYRGYP